jgi:hypothetical protein
MTFKFWYLNLSIAANSLVVFEDIIGPQNTVNVGLDDILFTPLPDDVC